LTPSSGDVDLSSVMVPGSTLCGVQALVVILVKGESPVDYVAFHYIIDCGDGDNVDLGIELVDYDMYSAEAQDKLRNTYLSAGMKIFKALGIKDIKFVHTK
jgi:hypothetical protein